MSRGTAIGIVGLGRMGHDIAKRLLRNGCNVVGFDVEKEAIHSLLSLGVVNATSLESFGSLLSPPRIVWVMVPSGEATEACVDALSNVLSPGDVLIDGGNSNYRDSVRRAEKLESLGISMLDVGTSGGIWGDQIGFSLMVGGERTAFERVEPIFRVLAPGPDQGYGYVGQSGSGHFAKMVHNGIEYGLMQAYGEGFALLEAKKEFDFDLAQVSDIWRYGSVIRSWLLDLTSNVMKEGPELSGYSGLVADSGEGRWALMEAMDLDVPTPVLALALQLRLRSRTSHPFSDRLLVALRKAFGGH